MLVSTLTQPFLHDLIQDVMDSGIASHASTDDSGTIWETSDDGYTQETQAS